MARLGVLPVGQGTPQLLPHPKGVTLFHARHRLANSFPRHEDIAPARSRRPVDYPCIGKRMKLKIIFRKEVRFKGPKPLVAVAIRPTTFHSLRKLVVAEKSAPNMRRID
jgi:hypothetical protein